MKRRGPRWPALIAGLSLLLAISPTMLSTFAQLTATTANPGSVFETTALYAPTNLSATASGSSISLSWTAGSNGTGYLVLGGNNASSSTCPAATTTSFYTVTVGTSTGTTYTDNRTISSGTYFCYQVQTTYGSWTSVQSNPVVAVGSITLTPPTNLVGSPSGRDALLNWTAGSGGTGYSVLGVGNGTSSTCPANTSISYASVGTSTTTAYTDTNRSPAVVPQGTYYCYLVQTTNGSLSSTGNPTVGVQVGVVAKTVQLVNGGVAGQLDTGDQIIITFNQAIDPTTGPTSTNTVCSNSNTVWIGSTATSGGCLTTETVNVGKLTGGTFDQNTRWNATYTWTNSNTTLTVTLGSRVSGNKVPNMSTSTWTFTPTTTATGLLSNKGRYHVCDNNTGGGNCTPSTTSATTSAPVRQSNSAASPSATQSATRTPTQTAWPTSTATASPTFSPTPSATRTHTTTPTTMPAATDAPETSDSAPTAAASATPKTDAPGPTFTSATPPTSKPSKTPTREATLTPTHTATRMSTMTATYTSTATHTPASSPTHTATVTASATMTLTATLTPSPTDAPTETPRATSTTAPSHTPTAAPSDTPEATREPTDPPIAPSPTRTPRPTP